MNNTLLSAVLVEVRLLKSALSRFEAEMQRLQQEALPLRTEYPTTVEHWFTPANETCIQYGALDGADNDLPADRCESDA